MDFFEREDKARRNTGLLELYFFLAILGIIFTLYVAALFIGAYVAARTHYDLAYNGNIWNPKLLLAVAGGTLAMIGGGSLYKMQQLSSGGSSVAEMLGGRPVAANTTDEDERKLLNVVEEMAIASGTPVPQLYVLPQELGINAFAAGHTTSDTVICVTRGAMKLLTRDELQGVIGHEFSHILNGDMRLNLRLMGLVFGILCLALFGRILVNIRSGGRVSVSDSRNPLPALSLITVMILLGLILLMIGSVGVFFGKLIKSAVSRQREFLADASAVQFTRNPEGLVSALKKVGGCGSRIEDPNAEDASHLFFANGLRESFFGLFATHPPLEERIRALDPSFDGKFTSVQLADAEERETEPMMAAQVAGPPPIIPAPQLGDLLGNLTSALGARSSTVPWGASAVQIQRVMPHVGTVTPQHLEYAADLRSNLPPLLTAAARDPMSAVALIYAMLLSPDESLRTRQLAQLQKQADAAIADKTARLYPNVAALESRARLPLVALTLTALRQLSPNQYQQFSDALKYIVESDQQIELFEYMLQKMVLRQLEPCFKPARRPVVQYYVIRPVIPDCAVLLSALAYAGQTQADAISVAFHQGADKLGLGDLKLVEASECGLDKVDAALEHLNQAAPQLKKLVLAACAATVAADGVIQEYEAELLRAIADSLDCPIPPFLTL